MTKPVVTEVRVFNETLRFRWTCSTCSTEGAWMTTLHEAELAASAHNRKAHDATAVRA